MGAAEVVPGVSGGTIAFVSGLYERLINGIRGLTPVKLLRLPVVGLRQWCIELDLGFLFTLFGAMMLAVLLLARGVSYLLEFHPVMIWAFFFGLVLASVFVMGRKLLPLATTTGLALGVGIAFGLMVTRLVPVDAEITPIALFIGGCIAVCAWILPGLSGSFILLILGLYQAVIGAVKDLDLLTLTYVGLGCIVGLMSFSRVLSMLLEKFHQLTVAVLVGFMVGSLVKIWPWKHTTSYQIKADGSQVPVIQESVLPGTYTHLTGADADLLPALAGCLLGAILIVVMDRFAFLAESNDDKAA